MKNIIIIFAAVFAFCGTLAAQIDRSVQPEPGPAPTIQIGDYEAFTMDNGLRVIVVENERSPRISFNLTLNIDPVMEGDAAGYVSMFGSQLRSGTTNRDKATLDNEIDFIGASLSASSRGVFGSALARHSETLMELMADVLQNPTFPQEELDRAITQSKSGLSTVPTDAQAIVSNLSSAILFPNHPYGEVMTEETIENITRDHIVDYYNTYFKPNVGFLVIVGNINVEEAKELTQRFLGDWEAGEVPSHEYETPQAPDGLRVSFANRPGAVQSVFRVSYPVELTPGHPDAIKASVMNSILGGGVFSGRLMQNLREDKGYTYGARSRLSTDRLVGTFSAGAEVGNNVTDSAIVEVLYEMERMVNEPVDERSLELIKNFMNGSFARSLESPQTVARFALNIERFNLPEDYYATYLERLMAVTAEDVQEMARKYIKPGNAHILVAGNEDEIPERLLRFAHDGQVHFYDAFARPIEKSDVELDESVTAEWVISQYIDAIGGKDAIKAIEDITIVRTAEMMGSSIKETTRKKTPYKMLMEVEMAGNVLQREVFDGEAGYSSSMGQRMPTPESDIEGQRQRAKIVRELSYLDGDVEMELRGVERIEGKDAYRIRVTTADGTVVDEYYDMETFLKVRESVTMEQMGQTQTITSDFHDYKEVSGVYFPYKVSLTGVGPMPIEMETEKLEVNTGLDPALFSVE